MKELNLSRCEYEVFMLLKQGNSPSEISEKINVSVRTIESHLQNIYCKGGFKHVYGLLAYNGEIKVIKKRTIIKSDLFLKTKELIESGKERGEIMKELNIDRRVFGMIKRNIINSIYTFSQEEVI